MVHAWTPKGNKRYRYYVCGSAQNRGWDTCPAPSIPAAEIERFVVERSRAIGKDSDVLARTLEQARRHAIGEVAENGDRETSRSCIGKDLVAPMEFARRSLQNRYPRGSRLVR
jgi:site-specific DNA recombinase